MARSNRPVNTNTKIVVVSVAMNRHESAFTTERVDDSLNIVLSIDTKKAREAFASRAFGIVRP